MKELDQIAEEQQLRQRVRDRERELGLRHTRKKPAWGKAMMAVVYGLCIEIVIYAEVVMWMRFDLSALYALIGVPAAMFGVFWAYAQKSAKENTKGGIVYDMNIRQAETDDLAGMEPETTQIPERVSDKEQKHDFRNFFTGIDDRIYFYGAVY